MSLSQPYARYQQTSVETASPTRLIVMLYDGAIRFLSRALPEMAARNFEAQSRLIGSAQAILAHLRATLNFEAGPVAHTLDASYACAYESLTEANLSDRPELVETVLCALREWREAWVEVDRQCQSRRAELSGELVAA